MLSVFIGEKIQTKNYCMHKRSEGFLAEHSVLLYRSFRKVKINYLKIVN